MGGTPFVYQGEELGIPNADFASLEELRDVDTRRPIEIMLEDGEIDSYQDVRAVVNHRSRDHARTPMHWSDADNAGFTDGEPWIKVNERYPEINAADQLGREDSIRAYYRELIDLRQAEDALVYGDYELFAPADEELYAYRRTLGDQQWLVVLNWSDRPQERSLASAVGVEEGSVVIGNYDDPDGDLTELSLSPYEARVYRL
jgi:oligo-1,6-glucosidase